MAADDSGDRRCAGRSEVNSYPDGFGGGLFISGGTDGDFGN